MHERDQASDEKPRRGGARMVSVAVGAAVSFGVITATVSGPAQAEATRPASSQQQTVSTAVPPSVATPIKLAGTALAQAEAQVARRQIAAAITTLTTLQVDVRNAHTAGMAQIGRPPADPESDDPPGPPSVIAVLALEHRVTMGIVPLFNGRKRSDIVQELRDTLYVTHTLRRQMLNRVTALPEEENTP